MGWEKRSPFQGSPSFFLNRREGHFLPLPEVQYSPSPFFSARASTRHLRSRVFSRIEEHFLPEGRWALLFYRQASSSFRRPLFPLKEAPFLSLLPPFSHDESVLDLFGSALPALKVIATGFSIWECGIPPLPRSAFDGVFGSSFPARDVSRTLRPLFSTSSAIQRLLSPLLSVRLSSLPGSCVLGTRVDPLSGFPSCFRPSLFYDCFHFSFRQREE